jgi:hypothetical protein
MLPNILLVLAVIGFLAAGLMFALRRTDAIKISQLQAALQSAESRVARSGVSQDPGGAKKPSKDNSKSVSQTAQSAQSSGELLSLRKEVAALRSQVAAHRSEAKEFTSRIHDAVRAKENDIDQLTKDRLLLIGTVKELETRLAAQNTAGKGVAGPAPLQRVAVSDDPESSASQELKRKVVTLERALKSEREQGDALRLDRQNLQAELRKWTHVAQDEGGKPLDPILFKKWKERALAARVQYQMMRQLRELSDIKLSTYQSSVVRLASFVFESTGTKAPRLGAGEVASDRYLAEALATLASRSEDNSDLPSHGIQGASAQSTLAGAQGLSELAEDSETHSEDVEIPRPQGDLSQSG